jgi:1-acyl-sn-glycerol-3-phosphate acyltransferase
MSGGGSMAGSRDRGKPISTVSTPNPEPEVLRKYSPRAVGWFARWLRGYFGRNFDGVRVSLDGQPPAGGDHPYIVYTNHPSWWDPVLFIYLSHTLLPQRRMFGPFDADALAKYPMFRRLGGYPVERSTRQGAADFLRTSRAILGAPNTVLWITAQGEFADPRRRPLVLQPGLAHLMRRLESGIVVPLAVEYPFWNERRPEALVRFGRPLEVTGCADRSVAELDALLAERLTETLDDLAEEAISRDASRFHTLLLGRTGIGGAYDLNRRLKAWSSGRKFDSAHDDDRG